MATIEGMAIEMSRLLTGSVPSFSAAGRPLFKNSFLILDNIPLFFRCPVHLVAIASERRHRNVCLNVESEFAVSVVYRLHGDA